MRSIKRHLKDTLALARARPDYATGLRAAAATVLPLLFGELHGSPAFVWVALGGWLTTLADPGGASRARATAMLRYVIAAAAVMFLGAVIGADPVAAPAALFVIAAACGLARVRGDSAAAFGTLLLVTFCIAIGNPSVTLEAAAGRAVALGAGGVYAIALGLAVFAVHPFKPGREAVGQCYAALAALVSGARGLFARHATEEEWNAYLRKERTHVREALERARSVLARIRRNRESASRRGELLVVLAEVAELSLGTVAALTETGAPDDRVLAAAQRAFESIAAAVPSATLPAATALPEVPEDDVLLKALVAEVRLALEQARFLGLRTGELPVAGPRLWQSDDPVPSIRDVLRPRSRVLQHAVRVALTTTASLVAANALGLQRTQWITVTVVIILQPSAGATIRRALGRVAGTVAGASVAALLAPLLRGPLGVAAAMFPLSVLALALRPLNYGLYAALVTPVFVLMAESLAGDFNLVRVRILNTLFGGAFALAAAFLLWRVHEREELAVHLAKLFEGLRGYLQAATSGAQRVEIVAARRRSGLAAANAEASLQRLLAEEHTDAEIEAAMGALAWSRRVAGAITVLSVTPGSDAVRTKAAAEVLGDLEQAMAARALPAPVPITPDAPPPWARLERSLEALRSSVARLAQRNA